MPPDRPLEDVLERAQLTAAPDERREHAIVQAFEGAGSALHRRHRIRTDRLGLPFHLEVAEVLEAERAIPQALRAPAHYDLPGLGDGEQPRGDVGGVAHRGVVHAEIPSDRAHHHGARVDAHPHAEVDLVHTFDVGGERDEVLLDRQRRPERARRVVFMGDGGAEERHHAIAEELVDGALVAMDRGEDDFEGAVHDAVDVLGIEPLRHRGEARDVGEHHGDGLALALDRPFRREDLLGEVPGGIRRGGGVPKGRARRGRRRSRGGRRGRRDRGDELRPAFAAELPRRLVGLAAAGAREGQSRAALATELRPGRVRLLALRARRQPQNLPHRQRDMAAPRA